MTMVNEQTGELADIQLVPLGLSDLDEDELLKMFPSPVQCAGALLIARRHLAEAPAVINERSRRLKAAKRMLIVARGYALKQVEGRTAEIRKAVAEAEPNVITAWEHIDECELALEYAREVRKSLSEDVEILRSLNANFRTEHRS